MPYIDHAAILTLAYGTRPEHAVIYASSRFDKLYDFLKDPWTFFERGADWMSSELWDMDTPLTICIEPVELGDIALPEMLDTLFRIDQDALKKLQPKGEIFEKVSRNENGLVTDINHLDIRAETLRTAFPEGAFIVQFAFGTHVVSVKYLADPTPAEDMFYEEVTPINLMHYSSKNATLHFDIGNEQSSRAILRAKFAMDYIKDRVDLLNRCFDDINQFYKGEARFIERGQPIVRSRLYGSTKPVLVEAVWKPRVVITDVVARTKPAPNVPGQDCKCPVIDVPHHVDDDDKGFICVDVPLCDMVPGTLTLKTYMPPPPGGGG